MLDWVALGLLGWLLLAMVAAVILGRSVALADRRAAGRMRHAPPAGWLERQTCPETTSPPAGSQGAGGDGVGAGAGRRRTP